MMRKIWLAVLAAGVMAGTALAQSGTMSGPSTMGGSDQSMGKTMHHMGATPSGTHTMPATVTSVDQKTGVVEVNSAGMALKLHFPPASLADVKAGDKITLHLGFTKA